MAGKATSIYLSIVPKGDFKAVFRKTFFEAKAYNEYIRSEEFKAQWPESEYTIIKETY
jgi:hypothetical protein